MYILRITSPLFPEGRLTEFETFPEAHERATRLFIFNIQPEMGGYYYDTFRVEILQEGKVVFSIAQEMLIKNWYDKKGRPI